jgi:hypothetical protein
MKHRIIILLLLTVFNAAGQSSYPRACPKSDPASQRLLFRTYTESESEQQPTTARQKERLFLLRIEKFITSWTALAREYNEKGAFNVKKAREVSKTFHDLEKSEGWPKVDHR